MQIVQHLGRHFGAEVGQRLVLHAYIAAQVFAGQPVPQGMGARRLACAGHQALPAVQCPAVHGGGQAAALVGRGIAGMGGAQVAVGAAVQLDQAVEDGGAGQAAAAQVLDVNVALAIGLAVAHQQVGIVHQGNAGDAVQAVAGGVQPAVQGGQFILDRGGWRIHVDAQLGRLQEGGVRRCRRVAGSKKTGTA